MMYLSPMGDAKGAAHTMTLAGSNIFEVIRRKSGWFLALGIILILLGTIALVAQFASTVATMVFLGWLLLFSGAFHVIQGFQAVGWRGIALHFLVGVVDVFAGAWLIWQPLAGSIALTLFLAFWFLASGMFQIIAAMANHLPNRAWAILSGVISLLLGLSLWLSWPTSALFWVTDLAVSAMRLRGRTK